GPKSTQVKLLGLGLVAQPDGSDVEVGTGIRDAGCKEYGLQLQGVKQHLDAVGQLQTVAALHVDDSQQPVRTLCSHFQEVGIVVAEGDEVGVEAVGCEEGSRGPERDLVEVAARRGRAQQVECGSLVVPTLRQWPGSRRNLDAPGQQLIDDLALPQRAGGQDGA